MTETMTRHRISVAEYEAMGENGVPPPDLRTELLDGEVLEMSHRRPVSNGREAAVYPSDSADGADGAGPGEVGPWQSCA